MITTHQRAIADEVRKALCAARDAAKLETERLRLRQFDSEPFEVRGHRMRVRVRRESRNGRSALYARFEWLALPGSRFRVRVRGENDIVWSIARRDGMPVWKPLG